MFPTILNTHHISKVSLPKLIWPCLPNTLQENILPYKNLNLETSTTTKDTNKYKMIDNTQNPVHVSLISDLMDQLTQCYLLLKIEYFYYVVSKILR